MNSVGLDIRSEFQQARQLDAASALRRRLRGASEQVASTVAHATAPTWNDWLNRWTQLDASCGGDFVAMMRQAHGGVAATVNLLRDDTADNQSLRTLWTAPCATMEQRVIESCWRAIAQQFECCNAGVRFALGPEPGRCTMIDSSHIIVNLQVGDDGVAWCNAFHEFGHAVAACVVQRELPRAVDEAVAEVFAATLLRDASGVAALHSLAPAAAAMQQRRRGIAATLAAAEQLRSPLNMDHVPWALWHQPGYQAAYLAAHDLAAPWLRHGFASRHELKAFIDDTCGGIDGSMVDRNVGPRSL
jgi:hypothetical protein